MKIENYEREAINILCSGVLNNSILHGALNHPESIDVDFTGEGYYLTIKHKELPAERIVCDKPMLVGIFQEQEVGFIVFVENNSLCLECYNLSTKGVPESIRNGTVILKTT